jgi:hypothetical protein
VFSTVDLKLQTLFSGDLLIDDEVVGKGLVNIDLKFRFELNEEEDRVFSDFCTGDLYKEVCENVEQVDGDDVISLCLGLNMDKTHMSRLQDLQSCPCNVSLLNLKTRVVSTRKGSGLIGYCPILNVSERSLAPFLQQAGVSKSNHADAIKLLKRLLEQDYIQEIIEPIIRLSELPPIPLQYGSNKKCIRRTRMFIVVYIGILSLNFNIICFFF